MNTASFRFVDLFSGIGGFHAVMSALGGQCVYASEIEPKAAEVYRRNWGINPLGDVTQDANDNVMKVPPHDVLCAGFPCQPFSKSGAQRGMDETRGTLYWNVLKVIETRRPVIVFLENVRNLFGPRHRHEWQIIIQTLRDQGYKVSDEPSIFSPHLLPPEFGGRPQARERVFILATRVEEPSLQSEIFVRPAVVNQPVGVWDPTFWHLESDLPLQEDCDVAGCNLTEREVLWLNAWDDFVRNMKRIRDGRRLPGFPLWADVWVTRELPTDNTRKVPAWKLELLRKNHEFYQAHQNFIDHWVEKWGLYGPLFPASRRKLEWQAQDLESLWDCVLHLRPSGIRAKAPTYLPALVAISQVSVIGPRARRLSPREAARLQGFPDWFEFGEQKSSITYRQLGNAVSISAAWYVFKRHVIRDEEILKKSAPLIYQNISSSADSPDTFLLNKPCAH
jgi:DNA (cytosine-5)-methyltransferase 1